MKTIPLWAQILIIAFIAFWAYRLYPDKDYCHCTVGADYYADYQFGHDHIRETQWAPEYKSIVAKVLATFGGRVDFMYAEATYPFFWFISLPPIDTAYLLWYIGQVLCAGFIVWRICKIDYGWVWALSGIKIAIFGFQSGNIAIYLAAAGMFTVGAFVSAVFKPYYLVVAFCSSILNRKWEFNKWLMLLSLGAVGVLAFPNAWLQVVQGNDGTTWILNKYWILFAPVIPQLWKVERIKKHWWATGVIGAALLALSSWNWWLSPATRAILLSTNTLALAAFVVTLLILASIWFLAWGFLSAFDGEEKRRRP